MFLNAQNRDDQPFRHYSMKHRVVARISQSLFDHVTYTVRHGLLKGMKRKGGLGWLPEFMVGGSTKTPEHYFWFAQDFTGLVVYDIGAFQGLLTLYFARNSRRVISYEPNSKNQARLRENIQLNRATNVLVRPVGLGSEHRLATMVSSPLTPGGAKIETDAVAGVLNSSGSAHSEQVPVTTLDRDIEEMSLPAPDFIKIDVEGQELAVLAGARDTLLRHKPRLFLEMHGETLNLKRKHAAAIIAELHELGYRGILHVESGAAIDRDNSALAAQGHLYCQS